MKFEHYTIRPLIMDDLLPYFDMVQRNRSRLGDCFTGTVSRTGNLEDTRMFLEDITARAESKTYFPYLIIDEHNGAFAGFLDLKNIDWSIPKSEVGCYIDGDYASKGIGMKAFQVFCEFCFSNFQFRKLFLRTHESNSAAKRIAENSGFQQEGIIRCDYKTASGAIVDLIYYGRLR